MTSLLDRTAPVNVMAGLRRRFRDPEPGARVPITEDQLFQILADSRRRAVINRLATMDHDEAVRRVELAREIAAMETHMSPEHVPDERVRPVDVDLYRTHFPMLDDAELIRWNVAEAEVAPANSIAPVAEWLREAEGFTDRAPHLRHRSSGQNSDPVWR